MAIVTTILSVLEQNLYIIDMALDYLSIDFSEKEKIIELLEKKSKEDSDLKLTELFQQANLISDKETDYLLIFDAYLQNLYQDQQFARLAIANGLASEKEVADAFEHQQQCFKKYRINMEIGEILAENKVITPRDRISILLTQNRIEDSKLLDAFNAMGSTQLEKEAINKRFGILAIKKQLVTIEQVNQALEVQKKDRLAKVKPCFISQILQETAYLSDDIVLQILLEQKQVEKKRLDLEKALYTPQSEIEVSRKLNKLFDYQISKDGVEAFVKKIKETSEVILVYEFLIWLRRVGIRFGIVEDAVLDAFIQKAEKNTQILVAKGVAAEPCTHESIQIYFENEFIPVCQYSNDTQSDPTEPDSVEKNQVEPLKKDDTVEEKTIKKEQTQEQNPEQTQEQAQEKTQEKTQEKNREQADAQIKVDKSVAQKERKDPLLIKKGSILARVIPGKEGKPGKNVSGYPIQPDRPVPCVLNARSGVIKKGLTFFAQIDGHPVLKQGTTLMVEPIVNKPQIKTIAGSITNDTQDLYDSTDMVINGTITAGAVLKCQSLLLYGSLLGSVITSCDIEVKGDIGTDKKPKDSGIIEQASVFCQGSVKVSKSIIHSKIQTAGELFAPNSKLIGSKVIAFKGMAIGEVEKGEQGPSVLQFGLKPDDRIIPIDQAIEEKKAQLFILKKQDAIDELTQAYRKELEEEETHQMEQAILKNFIEVIEGPELYQHVGIEAKFNYLKQLPDYSSIKAYYLKIPETQAGLAFFNQTKASILDLPQDIAIKNIRQKIDPEPESKEEDVVSQAKGIQIQFKARLAVIEKEVADQSEEIEKIENEINKLQTLRSKLGSIHLNSLSQSTSAIKIKNKCEKGTIIKGKVAWLVVEKTVYNIIFKEVFDPQTRTASIAIET
ncbi:MAG: flagellar assembly protein A [Pseudomonadota bacterium]